MSRPVEESWIERNRLSESSSRNRRDEERETRCVGCAADDVPLNEECLCEMCRGAEVTQ